MRDPKLPGIARATAVTLLPAHLTAASLPALQKAAADPDPLVRLAAASVMDALSPKDRLRVGVTLLWDPVRAVRIEAVVGVRGRARRRARRASSERRSTARSTTTCWPSARTRSAPRHTSRSGSSSPSAAGWRRRAGPTRRRCGSRPWFVPAHVNLADLLRPQGRDDEGEVVLRQALRGHAGSPSLHHALGLLLARRGRPGEPSPSCGAPSSWTRRIRGSPEAYALSLQSAGRSEEALVALRAAQRLSPGARELLVPLVTISRDRGSPREAKIVGAAAPGDEPGRPRGACARPGSSSRARRGASTACYQAFSIWRQPSSARLGRLRAPAGVEPGGGRGRAAAPAVADDVERLRERGLLWARERMVDVVARPRSRPGSRRRSPPRRARS